MEAKRLNKLSEEKAHVFLPIGKFSLKHELQKMLNKPLWLIANLLFLLIAFAAIFFGFPVIAELFTN